MRGCEKIPDRPRRGDFSHPLSFWGLRPQTPSEFLAECVNAIARNRGLRQFLVRGLKKVRAVVLWYALAHNLMRTGALGAR